MKSIRRSAMVIAVLGLSLPFAGCQSRCPDVPYTTTQSVRNLSMVNEPVRAKIVECIADGDRLVVFVAIKRSKLKYETTGSVLSNASKGISNEEPSGIVTAWDDAGPIPLRACNCARDAHFASGVSKDGTARIHPLEYLCDRPLSTNIHAELGEQFFEQMKLYGVTIVD